MAEERLELALYRLRAAKDRETGTPTPKKQRNPKTKPANPEGAITSTFSKPHKQRPKRHG